MQQWPTSHADAVAMLHDIDYLIANGDTQLTKEADDFAIRLSDGYYDLQSLSLKTGLSIRKFFNLGFSKNGNPKLGKYLKQYVKFKYSKRYMDEFNINLEQWN